MLGWEPQIKKAKQQLTRPLASHPPRDTARQQKLVTVERIVTLVMFIANAQAETDRIAAMLLRVSGVCNSDARPDSPPLAARMNF
jgi:hypothetical protein